ncbi:MAG TPA: CheR family methyltransferase [Terriglobales bacterium]|jgi:two-component system CheB/CheR fusion protein|nr:CheR family methyltransferase [Terriglobales bacterium]
MTDNDQLSLHQLLSELANNRNLDLRGFKTTTLERRIRKRMSEVNTSGYANYLEKVYQDPHEVDTLLNTILINVTEFFRDPQAWEALRAEVLPGILSALKPGDTFRAWCAGCASGEEPYSLAILISDYLRDKLGDYDIKIYATDIDEEALTAARRGEYAAERLRRVRSEWRERFFTGGARLRINREQRRLVIFGHSNLMVDAPISHCQLILCRNLLIYFDTAAQKQILGRMHYALEPGGILFLGKAESKLSESHLFRPLSLRWRLFQRQDNRAETIGLPPVREMGAEPPPMDKTTQRLQMLQLFHHYILDTLKTGIMELDKSDLIATHNDAALEIWGLAGARLQGKRLQNTEVVVRCPEMVRHLEESRSKPEPVEFQFTMRSDEEEKTIHVVIRAIVSAEGERTGTLIHCDDISVQEKLQTTIEQLESTGEELQSANEELETTNEELQSTNEELETTNEELQSTNEELETTNEELHSLNEELENMNDELEQRTRELHDLTSRYAETLRRMPWPVMLVDREEKIQLWNAAAQKLFGVSATSVVGVSIDRLPLEQSLSRTLIRRYRAVLKNQKGAVLHHLAFHIGAARQAFDVHFTPIARDAAMEGVLIMFGGPGERGARASNQAAASANPGNNRQPKVVKRAPAGQKKARKETRGRG